MTLLFDLALTHTCRFGLQRQTGSSGTPVFAKNDDSPAVAPNELDIRASAGGMLRYHVSHRG